MSRPATYLKKVRRSFTTAKEQQRGITPEYAYQLEVSALKRLQPYDHFPRLLEHNDDELTILLSYCGEHIERQRRLGNRIVVPSLEFQVECIVDALENENIIYLDVSEKNICFLDDMVYLIDFDLCIIDDVIPTARFQRGYDRFLSDGEWTGLYNKLVDRISQFTFRE